MRWIYLFQALIGYQKLSRTEGRDFKIQKPWNIYVDFDWFMRQRTLLATKSGESVKNRKQARSFHMHNAQVVINKRLRSQSCYSLVVVHNVWKYSIIRLILQMVTRIHISFSLKDCRHFFSFLRKMHLIFHQVFHFWRNCTFFVNFEG